MEGKRIDQLMYVSGDFEERAYVQKDFETAEREFYRSRRKARLRALRGWLGAKVESGSPTLPGPGGEIRIELDAVAGVEGEDGKPKKGVPPMSRRLLREWSVAYLRMGFEEEDRHFELRPHSGSWYLAGGGAALVGLELARMRGDRTIRAAIEGCAAPCAAQGAKDEGTCCDGDLGAA